MELKNKNTIYLYDGSYRGFLSCVFYCFENKEMPLEIVCEQDCEPTFFEQNFIPTDFSKAERVEKGIRLKASAQVLLMLRQGFNCAHPKKEKLLLDFIISALKNGRKITYMLSEKNVNELNKAIKSLTNEAQHYKGFIRFSVYDKSLIAVIEPKNFVLPYIAAHFCDRYKNESFFIYDKTHKVALIYQNSKASIVGVEEFTEIDYDKSEMDYRALWKSFYNVVCIKERENLKRRMSHMPKRFWNNITEMQQDGALEDKSKG